METLNLGQYAKQAVHLGLLQSDNPISTAEQVVAQELQDRLKGVAADDPEMLRGVRDICHGAVEGLFREHVRLSIGAVAVVRGAIRAGPELGQDNSTMIAYALAGIAELAESVSAPLLLSVQEEIAREFSSSAEVFGRLVERASAKRNHVLHAGQRHHS